MNLEPAAQGALTGSPREFGRIEEETIEVD
jgi:hypothetical protein